MLRSTILTRCCTLALPFCTALLLVLGTAACGGADPAHGPDTHTHAAEGEDHAHGEDTHTHEPMAADTAGTYVDTTGAFFEDEPADADSTDHEHGEHTHTHD